MEKGEINRENQQSPPHLCRASASTAPSPLLPSFTTLICLPDKSFFFFFCPRLGFLNSSQRTSRRGRREGLPLEKEMSTLLFLYFLLVRVFDAEVRQRDLFGSMQGKGGERCAPLSFSLLRQRESKLISP